MQNRFDRVIVDGAVQDILFEQFLQTLDRIPLQVQFAEQRFEAGNTAGAVEQAGKLLAEDNRKAGAVEGIGDDVRGPAEIGEPLLDADARAHALLRQPQLPLVLLRIRLAVENDDKFQPEQFRRAAEQLPLFRVRREDVRQKIRPAVFDARLRREGKKLFGRAEKYGIADLHGFDAEVFAADAYAVLFPHGYGVETLQQAALYLFQGLRRAVDGMAEGSRIGNLFMRAVCKIEHVIVRAQQPVIVVIPQLVGADQKLANVVVERRIFREGVTRADTVMPGGKAPHEGIALRLGGAAFQRPIEHQHVVSPIGDRLVQGVIGERTAVIFPVPPADDADVEVFFVQAAHGFRKRMRLQQPEKAGAVFVFMRGGEHVPVRLAREFDVDHPVEEQPALQLRVDFFGARRIEQNEARPLFVVEFGVGFADAPKVAQRKVTLAGQAVEAAVSTGFPAGCNGQKCFIIIAFPARNIIFCPSLITNSHRRRPTVFFLAAEIDGLDFAGRKFGGKFFEYRVRRNAVAHEVGGEERFVLLFERALQPRHLARTPDKQHQSALLQLCFDLFETIGGVALHIFRAAQKGKLRLVGNQDMPHARLFLGERRTAHVPAALQNVFRQQSEQAAGRTLRAQFVCARRRMAGRIRIVFVLRELRGAAGVAQPAVDTRV